MATEREVAVEVEPQTGISFPVTLDDGKLQLNCVCVRKKSMLGVGVKISTNGMYTDNEKLKDLLKSKIGAAPAKPTSQMYDLVIDSDVPMTIRMVIVFSGLTMNMVKKGMADNLATVIKKLNGGKKNDELSKTVLGPASDEIKLKPGSVLEFSRLPGHVLQTKVMGEMISKVESELLCRAFIHGYIGDDAQDKETKERYGMALLSLF
ncbi:hypothetical protein SLEP1_g45254 [Rubroshorea leprosula]|uniref:Chalcone isomerase n=1 Tax=Rubroshorea leprosula TaxID=152421 RepID=A0AAV5LK68_9ROSI|nr:hypothetical protein SLEP1_g45254 [Rubroshorea leprosula]